MFIYNGKEYDRVWFTSDEHYGSDRHIFLSQRMDFLDSIKKEKELRMCKQNMESMGMCDSEVKGMLNHIGNTSYGISLKTPVGMMGEKLITNHNKRVMHDDLVFHLGDFGTYAYAASLEGSHILVMGNYEYDECDKYFDSDFEKFKMYITGKYNFIDVIKDYRINIPLDNESHYNFKLWNMIKDDVAQIFITHKPEDCIRITDIINSNRKIMNLFGHIHEKGKVKRFGLNVGVDCHHFYPVSHDEVAFYLNAILHYYDDNVFM